LASENKSEGFAVSKIYLLKRAELAVRGCIEVALAEVDLTPSQFFILVLVKSGEATSSAELAREMGVLPQSMTELIAPLEQRGAIARRPDPENNRILRIGLTAAGERLFARGAEVGKRIERELFADSDEGEVGQLDRLFTTLIARAESHTYHPKLRRLAKSAAQPVPAVRKPAAARLPRSGARR
jgi:DNA-binding MarR family transcriptional regulator